MKKRIQGPGFSAEIEGETSWVFTYVGSRRVIAKGDRFLLFYESDVHGMPAIEREHLFDVAWQLGEPLGVQRVDLSWRAGDPYETETMRPKP